jgi:hypothetical protein
MCRSPWWGGRRTVFESESQPAEPNRPHRRRHAVAIAALLILVVGAAAYFRFVGQNWDDYTHLHPDERFLTMVVNDISPVESLAAYFDTAHSSLNPNNRGAAFYVYGTLPLFAVKAATAATVAMTGDPTWGAFGRIQLVGRSVSAVADLLTLLFLFLLGRQLYGPWTGLLAAALYATAVLPIQLAHFWTTDVVATLLVVIALWFAARALNDSRWAYHVGFGAALGAALACRINVAPLALVIVLPTLVHVLPSLRHGREPGSKRGVGAVFRAQTGGLLLAAVSCLLVFRLAQPYAFAGPGFLGLQPNPEWLADLAEQWRISRGQVDWPPDRQWVGRIPFLFAWSNMVVWGMGPALGLAAWIGWAAAAVRILGGRPGWTRHLLPVAWVLIYFGLMAPQRVASMRYFMPLYPALTLLAAWALTAFAARASGSRARLALSAGLLALVLAATSAWAFAFTRIYTRPLTRVAASHWILQNIPADYTLTIESPDGSSHRINLALPNTGPAAGGDPLASATRYAADDDEPKATRFVAPIAGIVSRIRATHLGDPRADPGAETLWVGLWDIEERRLLGEGTLTVDLALDAPTPLGAPHDIGLEQPVALVAGRPYELRTRALAGAPFTAAGAVIATEGPWDDDVPWPVCAPPEGWPPWTPEMPPGTVPLPVCRWLDGFGMGYYQHLALPMASPDGEDKRSAVLRALDVAEYLTISSNRFYDSLSRSPQRFPMTVRYYDALFRGALGFELVATFSSSPTLGQLAIPDQHLPTGGAPAWLNEWEAEEAFHVYDHPTVFLFRKTADYDPAVVAAILAGAAPSPVASDDGSIETGPFDDATR